MNMKKHRCRRLLACLICLSLWLAALSPALAEDMSAGLEGPVPEQAPFELSGDSDAEEPVGESAPEAETVAQPEEAETAIAAEALPDAPHEIEGAFAPEAPSEGDEAIEQGTPQEGDEAIAPGTPLEGDEAIEAEGALVSESDGGADAAEVPSAVESEAPEARAAAEATPDGEADGTGETEAILAAAAAASGLVLSESSLVLGVKETKTLQAKLNGKTAKELAFKSSNAKVAKVSASGTITAKKTGSTVITVTCKKYTAKCTVKVCKAPSKVTLSASTLTLGKGDQASLTAKLPSNTASKITWKSSKTKVAKVSATGVVTAVAKGTATITATTFNGKSASCKVTVKSPPTSISMDVTELDMTVGQSRKITVKVKGGAGDYALKVSGKAVQLSGNTITAVKKGTATVTASTYNGLSASCAVQVYGLPGKVSLSETRLELEPGETGRLVATLPANTRADLTWKSSDKAVAQVDSEGLVTAIGEGAAKITVTTSNGKKASCAVTVTPDIVEPELIDSRVMLDPGESLLISLGASRKISAMVEPEEYADMLEWSASSKAVALKTSAGKCTITAKSTGRAEVTARLPGGTSATVNVLVVDTTDTSNANIAAVQQALLNDERLFEPESGGDVVWALLEARLAACGISPERSAAIVDKVKNADALYRDIYIFAQGSFDIVGDATRDKHGALVGVTHYSLQDDTVYLQKNDSYDDEAYAYTMAHETGHAVEYNITGETGLASENDEAVAAIKADVRTLLMERVGEAVEAAGVEPDAVNTNQVVDALMDYRTLTQKEKVMQNLNRDEEAVYDALADIMASEMNATLPTNNGTMVWDAVEGVTNYAISGKFGHGYMLNMPQYAEAAKYYFYDRQGTPKITSEPWAEFFSANIVKDTATIAVNLSYLPQTCKYFAEVLAPKALDYFKGLVGG